MEAAMPGEGLEGARQPRFPVYDLRPPVKPTNAVLDLRARSHLVEMSARKRKTGGL
jgi:hypothetical protein